MPTMDASLKTHLGEWKFGFNHVTLSSGMHCHCNVSGHNSIGMWHPEEQLGLGAHGDVWKERAVNPFFALPLDHVRAVKKINKKHTNFIQSSQRELLALAKFSDKTATQVCKNLMITMFFVFTTP